MSASVLFDAPGPRARARHRLIAVVGGLALLGVLLLVLKALADNGDLAGAKWSPFLDWSTWRYYLLLGLINTLKAAALSVVLAIAFGVLFGLGRLSHNRPVRWASGVVVEFFRSVPVLIMMIFFFGIYATNQVFSAENNPFAAVVTGLTLYNGSVIAELVRSGIHSLPSGQAEAGLSIGLTRSQTMRAVLLPQAITAMLPALVSQLVVITKDTALGYIITYPELLQQANNLASLNSNVISALLVVAAIFIILNNILTAVAGRIEQRVNRRGGKALAGPARGDETVEEPGGEASVLDRPSAAG